MVIVPGKDCSSTGRWGLAWTESYCKKLPQSGGRGSVLIIHVCCGPQTTHMNLPQTDRHTVCLCVCVFLSWTKTNSRKVEAGEIYQRRWKTGWTWFQPLLIIPALVGSYVYVDFINSLGIDSLQPDRCCHRLKGLFLRLSAFHSKQPLPCCCFTGFIKLQYGKSWSCQTPNSHFIPLPESCDPFLFVLPFFSPPHPALLPSVHVSQRLDLNMLRIHGVKINNVISTLSQFSINDFEVCLSRHIHHDRSASECSSDTSAGQTDRRTDRQRQADRQRQVLGQ